MHDWKFSVLLESKVLKKTEVKDMIQIASMKKKDMGKFLKLKVETKAKENWEFVNDYKRKESIRPDFRSLHAACCNY